MSHRHHNPETRPEPNWALDHAPTFRAWATSCGAPVVVVAILDTGVDLGHPDLVGLPASAWEHIESEELTAHASAGVYRHGLAHRDLKAANILVARPDPDARAMLAKWVQPAPRRWPAPNATVEATEDVIQNQNRFDGSHGRTGENSRATTPLVRRAWAATRAQHCVLDARTLSAAHTPSIVAPILVRHCTRMLGEEGANEIATREFVRRAFGRAPNRIQVEVPSCKDTIDDLADTHHLGFVRRDVAVRMSAQANEDRWQEISDGALANLHATGSVRCDAHPGKAGLRLSSLLSRSPSRPPRSPGRHRHWVPMLRPSRHRVDRREAAVAHTVERHRFRHAHAQKGTLRPRTSWHCIPELPQANVVECVARPVAVARSSGVRRKRSSIVSSSERAQAGGFLGVSPVAGRQMREIH